MTVKWVCFLEIRRIAAQSDRFDAGRLEKLFGEVVPVQSKTAQVEKVGFMAKALLYARPFGLPGGIAGRRPRYAICREVNIDVLV